MSNNKPKPQFMFRFKKGSAVDNIMQALLDADRPLTNDELAKIGGSKYWGYSLQWLAKMTDNVAVVKDWGENSQTVTYVNPIPHTPKSVGMDIVINPELMQPGTVASLAQPEQPAVDFQDIRWPQAPPLIESMENFREPTWFNTMKAMVRNGRHIALAGPPGVGKDTAVQELAAREGKVLVTVGGDAGFRRRDLIGTPQIVRGSSFLEVAEYAAAVVNGWWALISEVNAADADALMFINSQLAPPYAVNIAGQSYPVHPDFRLFITYNAGLVGTKPLPQSFKDRFFSVQVPFFTNPQLRSILTAHGMPDEPWATMIVGFGIEMWRAHERGQLRYQITSRRLQDAVVLMTSGLCQSTQEALEMAVIAAIDSPIEAQVARRVLEVCHA